MRCNYYNSYYIHALIKQRNKTNGSTQSCIFDPLPNAKLSMSLSHVDTCTHQTRTPTYTCTIALQHIWIIKIKIPANTLICHVGENIIIYTIIHMLLYVSLCRNMLRLKCNLSQWIESKIKKKKKNRGRYTHWQDGQLSVCQRSNGPRVTKWKEVWSKDIWTSSWDYGTYDIGDQRRLRRACASAQSRQSLRCSHAWSMEVDEESDQTSDT